MNRRSNKILRELILGNRQSVLELEEKYNVQERTLRADIREINESLEQYALPQILIDMNGQLYLDTKEKADLRSFEKLICDHSFYTYYMSKNERATILAMILLNASGYVTVEQLKEMIGVSRNTLLRDLSELKKWFDENKLELVSQVRRGYIVNASELEIRKGILKLLEVNAENNDFETGYCLSAFWNLLIQQMDKLGIYSQMRKHIIHQEEVMQCFLSDFSFFETVLELTLIVNRIQKKHALPDYYRDSWKHLKESSKYTFASQLFEGMEKGFGYVFPETETLYFTECLKRKSYLKDKNHKSGSLDIRLLIAETLYQISNSFGIDFYLDFALYDLLIAHMRSAVYRIQTGEVLKNPLKDSLLREYPWIFEIIRENIKNLEDYIGGAFSEDEMSFMVLYFASVIEKEKAESSRSSRVRVALVCETGRGTAQFMMAKLHALEDMIDIVNVSSAHNAMEIRNSEAQMIISTIGLENEELPCVVVRSPMLSMEDLLDIQRVVFEVSEGRSSARRVLDADVKSPIEANITGAFFNLLSKERICLDYSATDWEDAVRFAGKLLYKTGAVEEIYIDAMVDNIKEHGPYIVIWPGTALPHADTKEGVKKEAASLVRLKTPVDFHNEMNDPVRYVIGISILSAESINKALYDVMAIFGNEKTKDVFDKINDTNDILKAIDNLRTI